MGYGEVIGNASVHWTVAHEDDNGAAMALSPKPGRAQHPKTGHDVHVDRSAKGCDPVEVTDVGRRKGHAGRYRVRLRFERMQDAKDAAAHVQQIVNEDGMYVLVIDVPAIRRNDPEDRPAAEIRIDW
jgi:hypothetical protein